MKKIYVIGIGFRPLDEKARTILLNSETVLINERLFEIFKGYDEYERVKDKVRVINNVEETMDFIKSQILNPKSQNIVLIAEGDPMFFGIGRRIVKEFGKESVEIYPDLSSVQVAFSRIKEPWGEAFLISLHGGPDPAKRRKLEYEIEDIPVLLERHNKIAILTDRENNPSEIAKVLLKSQIPIPKSQIIMYVCERLGYPDERITEGSAEKVAGMSFSTPNVVIIMKIES